MPADAIEGFSGANGHYVSWAAARTPASATERPASVIYS
jgi:hypothetical protein